ncbi:hypothetical protein HED51_18370 [Ochrobactrum grignonense]|nr:hypothetical protein [Brucella grignonensis]
MEQVEVRDGWIYFSGSEHHSRIDLSAIASLIADRSSVMQEKVYPVSIFLLKMRVWSAA